MPACKNQSIPSVFDHAQPKNLRSTFNLCQHAKNEAVSSICSGKIVDLNILQSGWLRAFWSIHAFFKQCFFPAQPVLLNFFMNSALYID